MKPEQEPKYDFNSHGQIINRATCKVIPDDEPVFILRAKDKNAALVIAYYKKLCSNDKHKAVINSRLNQFVNFAHEHPERMKEPDTDTYNNKLRDDQNPQQCIDSTDDCPFSYRLGTEPPAPVHKIIGTCVHCGRDAHTTDSKNRHSCYPCAYSDAS